MEQVKNELGYYQTTYHIFSCQVSSCIHVQLHSSHNLNGICGKNYGNNEII